MNINDYSQAWCVSFLRSLVQSLALQARRVVNDAAERGVALVQEFAKSGRTKSEEHLQFLLQIVEDNRSKFPTALKKSLMGK